MYIWNHVRLPNRKAITFSMYCSVYFPVNVTWLPLLTKCLFNFYWWFTDDNLLLAKSVISFNFPLFFHTATFAEAVERFNSNIPYNGLLHAVTQDVSTVGHSVSPFVSVSCFVTNSFFFPSLKLSIVCILCRGCLLKTRKSS